MSQIVCLLADHRPPLIYVVGDDHIILKVFSLGRIAELAQAVQWDHDHTCYCKYEVGAAWKVDLDDCHERNEREASHMYDTVKGGVPKHLAVCDDCQSRIQANFAPITPSLDDEMSISSIEGCQEHINALFVEKPGPWMDDTTQRYLAPNWEHYHPGLDRNFLPLYANNAPQPFPAEGPTHHAPSVKELPNPFFIPNLENRDNAIAEWARQPGHGRNQSEISDSTETTISSPSESDFIPPHDSPPVHAFSTDALFLRQDSHGSPPPPKILSIVPRLLLSQQHTQAYAGSHRFFDPVNNPELVCVDKTAALRIIELCGNYDYGPVVPFIRQRAGSGLATFTSMVAAFYDCQIPDSLATVFEDCSFGTRGMGSTIVLRLDLGNPSLYQDRSLSFSERLRCYLSQSIDNMITQYHDILEGIPKIVLFGSLNALQKFLMDRQGSPFKTHPIFIVVEQYTAPWSNEPNVASLHLEQILYEQVFSPIRMHLSNYNLAGALVTGKEWPNGPPPSNFLTLDPDPAHLRSRFVDLSSDPALATTFAFTAEEVRMVFELSMKRPLDEQTWEMLCMAKKTAPARDSTSFFGHYIQNEMAGALYHIGEVIRIIETAATSP